MLSLYMRKWWKGIKIQAIRVTNVKVDMHRYDHLSAFMKKIFIKLSQNFRLVLKKWLKFTQPYLQKMDMTVFLYDEKCREVKANRTAYEEEGQTKLYSLLEQLTFSRDNL